MTVKPETFFGTIAGNFIRHQVEPRNQLYVPNQESFPLPPEKIDVVRRAKTTLDVLLVYRRHGPGSCSSQY